MKHFWRNFVGYIYSRRYIENFFLILITVFLFSFAFHNKSFQINDINVLLTITALNLAIAALTPYFITKGAIKDSIKEEIDNDLKVSMLEQMEENKKTDAHISRMIALWLISKKQYIWATGWCFRSLKKYASLSGKYKHAYDDLIILTINILKDSINKVKKELQIEDFEEFVEKRGVLQCDKMKTFQNEYETEDYSVAFRAVKDYLDIRYCMTEMDTILGTADDTDLKEYDDYAVFLLYYIISCKLKKITDDSISISELKHKEDKIRSEIKKNLQKLARVKEKHAFDIIDTYFEIIPGLYGQKAVPAEKEKENCNA